MSAALALGQRAWSTARIVWGAPFAVRFRGVLQALLATLLLVAMISWNPADPSLNAASTQGATNWLGGVGATFADLMMQSLGLAAWPAVLLLIAFGLATAIGDALQHRLQPTAFKIFCAVVGVLLLSAALSALAAPAKWPLAAGLGGLWGDGVTGLSAQGLAALHIPAGRWIAGGLFLILGLWGLGYAVGLRLRDFTDTAGWAAEKNAARRAQQAERPAKPARVVAEAAPAAAAAPRRPRRVHEQAQTAPVAAPEAQGVEADAEPYAADPYADDEPAAYAPPWEDAAPAPVAPPSARPSKAAEPRVAAVKAPKPRTDADQVTFDFEPGEGFDLPSLGILAKPGQRVGSVDEESLKQNAKMLEGVLQEFGVRGVIDQIRPGPVVTLYELVPAPGVKHGRVVALADDIARSMSARACRISVVQGRNAIGIELPNAKRETVYLRDLLASGEYDKKSHLLPLALGETIGGEPYVADLARMPHLLIAGTTGSGKSVGVNAMILSILFRHTPAECRFIMIDPKMLELSVYDGIPHLLAPVVTDPKKAVVALKWTVREMEDRYRRMSKLGVRNVASYNERAREAQEKGEHFERTVQTGFDEQGRPVYESEKIRPEPMPYLVVVMDEMADLMLVAGKDVEGAVQRLAQMARAAGIHLIMATQRPSVDVITGTIKANFPTRISFQVTSKIDSRTILGEQGGEQLLGQGDMLYMAGGGRITRLHGPFVTDQEVEEVCKHLRLQAEPDYLDLITDEPDGDGDGAMGGDGDGMSGDDLYDRAVAVVTRDRKASTSYIQRRLQIGYNRAATLIERMEQEGVVSPANHAGKRDILAGPPPM
ncbi:MULTISPECIES: DNA translocase FtsK [unclassified Brevundimonas]|uniref:FtsK/SpoIIIE family DNA translocase n=1 Tax=unclassified Brevundimonas TaxID=2622653 RepID=UPI000CFCF8FA|nr:MULTISPECIES: DNA translocase FtsK [unclassified Brevundimonas]PRA36549.1 cell division protein FtsK [Brevundimonas sp. MYb27]PQZ78631.1 cell division protein FtsK [Brevundimonas sp. MYb31]PRB13591.1 cell division protein FtsK [Brevundimonas sp. MYb52]PRB34193.1 cell division protein FtsK [Brevundimonas sp. MYb46]PRB46587.1 cell division protein FtsK [Brevundimonas sp. MYb33]